MGKQPGPGTGAVRPNDPEERESERVHGNRPKPPWLRVKMPCGDNYERIRELIRSKSLNTVCDEAICPNRGECWGRGTATFMILGESCTRDCRFCAVKTDRFFRGTVDWNEPARLAEAVTVMKLRHVVITSVTRDDLPDGGAAVFAAAIRAVRSHAPGCTVEVLVPDFGGSRRALASVMEAGPDILGHNVETVPRLYPMVRPQALYRRSVELLRISRELSPAVIAKSGIMVGLGESFQEIVDVVSDLRTAGCDILTIGQYLRPTAAHLPVARYYTPEEFGALREVAYEAGFRWVESGPLVRSSYRAEAQARALTSPRHPLI